MNEVEMKIWGRAFKLDVVFDCYSGEEVLDIQRDAFNELLESDTEIELSLNSVKGYCKKHNPNDVGDEIDNIFRFVIPRSIFVKRSDDRIVAIMCNYKFDVEHRLAIVFKNGKLSEVGAEDIIL